MTERNNSKHITVLLDEAVEALDIQEGDVIVDATLGAGGHTLKILEKVGETGKVIAFDLDKQAIDEFIEVNNFKIESQGKLGKNILEVSERQVILVNDNFKNIKKNIERIYAGGGINSDKIDGILADLGWRIEQIQDERYGMSFQREMPLDMRMSPETQKLTAKKIVNEWSSDELGDIFRDLGEENYSDSKMIAREIVAQREKREIATTTELMELVSGVKRNVKPGINSATQIFQALRIVVNEELSNLNIFLEDSIDVLKNEGKLVVISFHSLEDRLVKKFFRAKARGCVCPKELPVCVCGKKSVGKVVQTKAIKESKNILKNNPRARSARMRIFEKKII